MSATNTDSPGRLSTVTLSFGPEMYGVLHRLMRLTGSPMEDVIGMALQDMDMIEDAYQSNTQVLLKYPSGRMQQVIRRRGLKKIGG